MSKSNLYNLASRHRYPAGVYIQFLLLWVGLADDDASDAELKIIVERLPSEMRTSDLNKLIPIAQKNQTADFIVACEAINMMPPEARELFVELAIDVAIADSRLTVSENQILRYFADVFLSDPLHINELYKDRTGKPLPEVVDLSSRNTWARRESRNTNRDGARDNSQKQYGSNNKQSTKMSRISALATLGLEGNPSKEEIKRAYRRLAQVHHPDRYSPLGKDAESVANHIFQRIQEAYSFLMS